MSELQISKMGIGQLRNEVQYLRDELAKMKRHYEDLLYNLDDDNITSISADKIQGLVVGSVTADSLYAEYGDIADLTVDRISTAKRVKKYLLGDVSEDTFFEGYDKGIYFVQGVVEYDSYDESGQPSTGAMPLTEQLTNRYGTLLWWSGVIAYTSGGIAYDSEGNQLLITDKSSSGEPVIAYKYKKNVKLKIEFYTGADGIANPRITLGIGTDTTGMSDSGKAFIEKTADGVAITYKHSDGENTTAVEMNDGGGRLVGAWEGVGDTVIKEIDYTTPSVIEFYTNGFAVTYSSDDGLNIKRTWIVSSTNMVCVEDGIVIDINDTEEELTL